MSNLIQFPADRWRPDYDELAKAITKYYRPNSGITLEEMAAICVTCGYPPDTMQNELKKFLRHE